MHHAYASWVEISKHAFEHNINLLRSSIGAKQIFAPVIKSNAYGHGIELIAELCEQNPAIDWLCVVSLSEAVFLRKKGIQKPLLVLSILDDDLENSIIHDIKVCTYDLATIITLNNIAQRHHKKANIHIKIDTGLSRTGLLWHEALPFIQKISTLPHIAIDGIFSHLARAESADQTFSNLQIERFTSLLTTIKNASIAIPHTHVSCSAAALINPLVQQFSLIRAGIGIYGLWPSTETKIGTIQRHPTFNLKPVMTWKTKLIQIKTVEAHTAVGYDLTYQTTRRTTLGLLPIGYWDGYDRHLSNTGLIKINGHYAPVVGRIAMNLTIVDITDSENSHVGDEVILLGNDALIHADAMAEKVGTINYEIVTRINPLLPRILVP